MLLPPGCGRDESHTSVEAPRVAADSWPAPSDEECAAYARQLEAAVADNPRAVNAMIDWDVLLKKVTAGIDGVDDFRRGFVRGIKKALDRTPSLAGQIVQAVQAGGSYQYLRTRHRAASKRVLFRLTLPDDNGINYHELILAKRPDGRIKALDIYVYASGETFSTTLRRIYLPVVAKQKRSLLAKLAKKESDFVSHVDKLQRMASGVRTGQYQQALDAYESLPPSVKKEKVFLLMRVQAAMHVNDDVYMAAIDDFRKNYPDDACIDLLSFDGHLIKKQYDQALGCIERLDRSVGGDLHLSVMRAGVYVKQGRYPEARKATQAVIDQLPDFEDSYWTMLDVSVHEKKFDEALKLLRHLEQEFDAVFADMTQIPDYAEFVKSPQFLEWKRSRGD